MAKATLKNSNNKQNMVCTYKGILFSLKKGSPITCYNMDESWGYYAKWNMPVPKRQILVIPFTWKLQVVKFIEIEVEW